MRFDLSHKGRGGTESRRETISRSTGSSASPALALKLTSSISEEETEGTWAPSEAREIATRVWLKMASAAARLIGSRR